MFERFNNQSRRVVVLAQEEARGFCHNHVGTEHLLLGLLCEGAGAGAKALAAVNVTLDAARGQLETIAGRGKQQPSGHLPFTPRAKKSLELALRESLKLGDDYIGTGHLLLGMIRQGDNVAIQMLGKLGIDLNDLGERVTQELHDHPERTDGVAAPAAPERERIELRERNEIQGLLDTIDERLSAIERHLGIPRAAPDELRRLDERIAEVRRDKEAAVEVQDFSRAATLRDTEKALLSERARVERKMKSDRGDPSATDAGAQADQLREPDIEPDEPADPSATDAGAQADQLREPDIEPDEPADPPAAPGSGC